MSAQSGTTRWWENYLVRYLMPSIAGVPIVGWLCAHGGPGFRMLLFLPAAGIMLDAPTLTLLFLYGNLFCYVASYPILVFHVTRVHDFREGKWPAMPAIDGYIATLVFTTLSFVLCLFKDTYFRCWLAFLVVGLLVLVQIIREYLVIFPRIEVRGLVGEVSPAFGYAFSLARIRGIPEQTETVVAPRPAPPGSAVRVLVEQGEEGEITTVRLDLWRRDFMETYRHMREHGNSAFMFLAELELAALLYCVVTTPGLAPVQQLGVVGVLLAVWAVPAVFVHLLGQHLERRFSRFDMRAS